MSMGQTVHLLLQIHMHLSLTNYDHPSLKITLTHTKVTQWRLQTPILKIGQIQFILSSNLPIKTQLPYVTENKKPSCLLLPHSRLCSKLAIVGKYHLQLFPRYKEIRVLGSWHCPFKVTSLDVIGYMTFRFAVVTDMISMTVVGQIGLLVLE